MAQTPLGRILRACIPWLLALLLAAIAVQIALAGTGLLTNPSYLEPHRMLAPGLTGLALLVVAIALAARDHPVAIGSGAIVILLLFQGPLIRSVGLVRSLHAVSALLAFAICLLLLRERLPLHRKSTP